MKRVEYGALLRVNTTLEDKQVCVCVCVCVCDVDRSCLTVYHRVKRKEIS